MAAIAQSSNCKSDYFDCRRPLNAKPKEILLECGNGTGSRTFTSASEIPFQLANVTIDTTIFCKPIVNIEFSSIVSFQLEDIGEDASVQLRYQLFRKCDDGRPMALGVWEFEISLGIDNTALQGTESFDFIFCDCMARSGCCDYFVTVTAVEILEDPESVSVATVENGRIAALAGEAW